MSIGLQDAFHWPNANPWAHQQPLRATSKGSTLVGPGGFIVKVVADPNWKEKTINITEITCLINLKPQFIGTYRKIYGIIAGLRQIPSYSWFALASLPSHPHRWRFVIYLVPPNTNVGNLSPSRTATAMHKCIKCMLTKNCHSDDPNSRQGVHVTSFYNCWD